MPSKPITPYPPSLQSLISSTTYPPLPPLPELESLQSILETQQQSLQGEIDRRERKDRKRKEREALEANLHIAQGIEAGDRARVEAQRAAAKSSRVKVERTVSPVPFSRPQKTVHPPVTYGSAQVKKKKAKRVLDSDDENPTNRDRSMTIPSPPPPTLPHQASTSGLKLKLLPTHPTKASPSPSLSGPSSLIDFSLPPPPNRPLVPPRPGVQPPPIPGPKRQADVDVDFSNVKAPVQDASNKFLGSVEPYLRDLMEDDLAMLGFKADAPESYEIPPKGRHYTETWDEEDGNPLGTTPRFSVPNLRQQATRQVSHFIPATELSDENLVDEQRGLGGLTERVVAALLGRIGFRRDNKGVDMDGGKEALRVDVFDLEERVKKELRAVQLLGEHDELDPNNRDDDEITAALRQCQRLLHHQSTLNDSRKSRLADVSRRRLAYIDYQTALEGIERNIETGWTKRVKKYGVPPKKGVVGVKPGVPEGLLKFVRVRQEWMGGVGRVLGDLPVGEVRGLREKGKSIYEGLEGTEGGAVGEGEEERDERWVEDGLDVGGAGGKMEVDE